MTRLRDGLSTPAVAVVAGLAAVVVAWTLLVPPGAGADEPAHLTRSAAIVRGETFGPPDPAPAGPNPGEYYEVPSRAEAPEPGCYAFHPDVAVSCVQPIADTGGDVRLISTSDEYPPWGHLVYGLGSLLPWIDSIWPVRLVGAAIAVALVGHTLRRAQSSTQRAGILMALTPTALATIATVNPSTFAIAGAIGCWAALLRHETRPFGWSDSWWFAASWAALVLTRRDGIVWACAIVALASLYRSRSGLALMTRLKRPAAAAVAATTLFMMVWGVAGSSRLSQLAALSPLLIVATDIGGAAVRRASTQRRVFVGVALVAVGLLVGVLALVVRPGGWDTDLAVVVWTFADDHLIEAVGVFGWLDVTIPGFALIGYCLALGGLFGVALTIQPRVAGWAVAVATAAVLSSWWLELMSGAEGGQYWQGRYSLPLLVGVPLVLSTITLDPARDRRVGLLTAIVALVVVNVAAWAGARRWGVGVYGTLRPWAWDTPIQPVQPFLLLAVIGIASILIVFGLSRSDALPSR